METLTTRPAGFSIEEAAHQLRISRSGVYRLIKTGQIRRVKVGHRSIIPASEIDRILEDTRPTPAA